MAPIVVVAMELLYVIRALLRIQQYAQRGVAIDLQPTRGSDVSRGLKLIVAGPNRACDQAGNLPAKRGRRDKTLV